MAQTIQIRRGTGSAVPSSLAAGELAINLDSGKLYYGQTDTSASSNFRFESITAETYTVSSSVTNLITQTSSGSTAFGNSGDDIHTFIGGISISGSMGFHSGSISSDLTGSFSHLIVGGGNFTSESLAAAASAESTDLSSYALISQISGAFNGQTGSFVTNSDTGSFLTSIPANLVSSSAQIATDISGAFNGQTGSFLTSIPANTISASAQIATDISGAFNGQTASFAVTDQDVRFNNIIATGNITAENYIISASVTTIITQTLSGSTQFGDSADDTHQFTGNITASGNISASGEVIFNNINGGTF